MKVFLKNIALLGLVLLIGILLILSIIAYSTNYTFLLEKLTFGNTNQWGSNYERSVDFISWTEKHDRPKGLILGSSTAYRNINPFILDSITKIDWYNLGNSSQTIDISNKLLGIALSKTKLDYVLLDLYPMLKKGDDYESAFDWIKNSTFTDEEKFKFLCSVDLDTKIISQYLYRSIKNKIPSVKIVVDEPLNGNYLGKGFVCSDKLLALEADTFSKSTNHISIDNNLTTLIKICKKENIQLIISLTPELGKSNKLDLKENHFIVINNDDFILASKSYHYYYDSHHLTCEGSRVFSEVLARKLLIPLNKSLVTSHQ